jgi:mono/diheme cytochrome c family protein
MSKQMRTTAIAAISTVALLAVAGAARHPGRDSAQPDPQVARGRQVVLEHGCGDCHGGIANPAAPYWLAGVRSPQQEFQIGPFKTRPRNLTPDNATGLGRFSERQIFNALRYGLRPGETPDVEITGTTPGQGNFPAVPKYMAVPMPWPSFRHMSDADLWAIAAYLKRGLKPVRNLVQDSDGPPDFWASEYTAEKIGVYPAPAYPTGNEK